MLSKGKVKNQADMNLRTKLEYCYVRSLDSLDGVFFQRLQTRYDPKYSSFLTLSLFCYTSLKYILSFETETTRVQLETLF